MEILWSYLPLEVFAHVLETCSVTNVIGLTSVCRTWRQNLQNESIWKDEPSTLKKSFRDRAIKREVISTNIAKNRYIKRFAKILPEDTTQSVSLSKDKALITYTKRLGVDSTSLELLDLNSLKTSNLVAKCKNMAITKGYYIYFVSTHPGVSVSSLTTGQKIDIQHRTRMQLTAAQSILLPIDNRQLLKVSLNTDLEENSFVAYSAALQKLFWIDPVSNSFQIIPLRDKINEARIDGKYISYSVQGKFNTHVYDWRPQKYIAHIENETVIYSWMIYHDNLFVSDSNGWHIRALDTTQVIKRCEYSFQSISPPLINYYNGIVVLKSEELHVFFNGCTAELLLEMKFDPPLISPKLVGVSHGKFWIWSTRATFLYDFELPTDNNSPN